MRVAFKEMKAESARHLVNKGSGHSTAAPLLFYAWAYQDGLSKAYGVGRWILTRGIPVERLVDEEERMILTMEMALGGT